MLLIVMMMLMIGWYRTGTGGRKKAAPAAVGAREVDVDGDDLGQELLRAPVVALRVAHLKLPPPGSCSKQIFGFFHNL